MTQIFKDIFGPKLLKENLVEEDEMHRLPSPHQLQGKIILNGTEKSKIENIRKVSVRKCMICATQIVHNFVVDKTTN